MDASSSLQTESSKNRITINVGGFRHETHLNTLLNISDTRLSWIVEHQNVFNSAEKREYFFDRHPGAFTQVLNYFRTGKLHCPTDMCGPMFEEELTFWGIDEKQMEPCCWGKYTQHREAEENLKDFVGPGFEPELKDDNNMGTRSTSSLLSQFDKESCWQKLKPKLWLHLDKPHSSKLAKMVSYLSCFFISLSVVTFCISTLPEMKAAGNFKAVGNNRALNKVETACSIFFTMEFIMRFLFCPSKFKFIQTPMDWLDFLAIIPFYVDLFVPNEIVKMFLVIRVFRLFRFIKLSYGLQIMIHTLKASSHELILLLLILLIPVVLFSSIVYYIEVILHDENSTFTSVPISLWWCLITMTTVGYGDMTPQTWPGKIMGGACAVCGVLIVALPISVIGSNFNLYYAHAQARLKLPMKQRHLVLGGVPGLISRYQELSSRRKKKSAVSADQQSEQETSYAEQSSVQASHVTNVQNHEPDPANAYHDSCDVRATLIPLIQTEDDGSNAGIGPGLSRRRPRHTAATLLPMMHLQIESEKRKAETDTTKGLSPTDKSGDSQPICENSQALDSRSATSKGLSPIDKSGGARPQLVCDNSQALESRSATSKGLSPIDKSGGARPQLVCDNSQALESRSATSKGLSPTDKSGVPQLICENSQTLDSRTTLSSPPNSPVFTPIATPMNGSLDHTTGADHLPTNVAHPHNPQLHSEETLLSNGRDVPSRRQSQSSIYGAEDFSGDNELRSHLSRPGLWRQKSFSDSKLFSLPVEARSDQSDSIGQDAKPTKNMAMHSYGSEGITKDVQPVKTGTNGTSSHEDPLENQTGEKLTLRKSPPCGDKKWLIGNGSSPGHSREGPLWSLRTTTHPSSNKSTVIPISLPANGTEQEFLETQI